MLTRQATKADIARWKRMYRRHAPRLSPNRVSGEAIAAYLRENYTVTDVTDEKWRRVVAGNVLGNAFSAQKLKPGQAPAPVAFRVENAGAGEALYAAQSAPFAGQAIYAGIDLTTGAFTVEGSETLWDELFAFRGLDADDLTNYFLVAQYIEALRKTGRTIPRPA